MRLAQRCALAAALFALPADAATELFSWHTFDVRAMAVGKLEITVHSRLRTRHEASHLDQVRGGPLVRWAATKRLTLLGGFYHQPTQVSKDHWFKGQRLIAGVESPLYHRPGHAVAGRFLAEHFAGTGRPDYTRYRASLRWTVGRGRVRPFVQNETFAAWPGFHSSRQSGGASIRLSEEMSMDVSYLYDIRRAFWGGDRQAIVTSVRWTPPLHKR
jgi:hypothetical protein